MQAVTVSEAGYAGAFTLQGATSSVATATCVPANCTPSSAGGTVTINIAPGSAAGSEAVSVVNANGDFANIPVTLTSSGGGGALVGGPYPIYEYSTTGGGTNYGITVGSDGQTLWFVNRGNAELGSVTNPGSCSASCSTIGEQSPFVIASGPPAPAALQSITAASDGNLYVADLGNGGSDLGQIFQVSCPSGICGQGVSESLSLATPAPADIIAAPDGNLYGTSQYSDSYTNGSILQAQIADCCPSGFGYFPASSVSTSLPNMLTVDQSGQTIWFTDTGTGEIGYFSLRATIASSPTCRRTRSTAAARGIVAHRVPTSPGRRRVTAASAAVAHFRHHSTASSPPPMAIYTLPKLVRTGSIS